ncbi:hypothetical protein PL9631_600009 [Planktothrix paucivesiculata PCC 9631]|uniref:Uncharacterized protein n=1 Tax=Planktothrix paucivesiculata PCC 9631 TaxID=671071 RepID=A0A7Z9BV03_9CYAN|nr:hypothetical protein PL9631_600009 [Planktothrix paucivesiculata PCC 9631]
MVICRYVFLIYSFKNTGTKRIAGGSKPSLDSETLSLVEVPTWFYPGQKLRQHGVAVDLIDNDHKRL